jgi:hypothetical protein
MTTSTSPVSSAPGQGLVWHTLSIEDALRAHGVDAAACLFIQQWSTALLLALRQEGKASSRAVRPCRR